MKLLKLFSMALGFLFTSFCWQSTTRAQCTNEWITEAPLNTPRHAFGACVDPCGNIYVIGGIKQPPFPGEILDKIEILAYDGNDYTTSWTFGSPLLTPRYAHGVICVNGFIYAIGGTHDATNIVASVDRYDTTTDTWSSTDIPDMNVPRAEPGVTVDKWGRIWVIGGYDGVSVVSSVEMYDPARPNDGWAVQLGLNVSRDSAGAVTDCQGRIYAIGGNNEDPGHLSSVERFDPCNPGEGWVFVADVPESSQTDEAVTGADCKIYVAGGWLPGYTNRVSRYEPQTNTWDSCQPLGQARNNLAVVLGANDRMFVMGGDVSGGPTSQSTVESMSTVEVCKQEPSIPAVSSSGIMIMTLLMMGVGAILIHRRLRFNT